MLHLVSKGRKRFHQYWAKQLKEEATQALTQSYANTRLLRRIAQENNNDDPRQSCMQTRIIAPRERSAHAPLVQIDRFRVPLLFFQDLRIAEVHALVINQRSRLGTTLKFADYRTESRSQITGTHRKDVRQQVKKWLGIVCGPLSLV